MGALAGKRQRNWKLWPVAVGSATSANGATTTVFSDPNIDATDTVQVTPTSASAAGLQGSAAGVYATVADGAVTLHHNAAAGTETWVISVIPVNL